jgi:hypothetical protein
MGQPCISTPKPPSKIKNPYVSNTCEYLCKKKCLTKYIPPPHSKVCDATKWTLIKEEFIPDGMVNQDYEFQFNLNLNDNQILVYFSAKGLSEIDLTLTAEGRMFGRPNKSGTFPFTIIARDNRPECPNQFYDYLINILPSNDPVYLSYLYDLDLCSYYNPNCGC